MGCAMNDSGQFEGVCRIGMPVFDRRGYPIASMRTPGLIMDLNRVHIPEIGGNVRAHAERVSAGLGSEE